MNMIYAYDQLYIGVSVSTLIIIATAPIPSLFIFSSLAFLQNTTQLFTSNATAPPTSVDTAKQ